MFAAILVAILASLAGAGAASADSSPVSDMEILRQTVALYERMQNSAVDASAAEELIENTNEDFIKAVQLGYVNYDDFETVMDSESVTKQDFLTMLYKTVINYEDKFAIDETETSILLNDCFDNAYIKDENRIAYAFMIKYGVISSNGITNPDEIVTWDLCSRLIDRVSSLFTQNKMFTIGDRTVEIGANIEEVLHAFGNPNRIDATENGFEWYVYNDDYREYCMIGVDEDRVCAFFSNSAGFEYRGLTPGCRGANTDGDENLRLFINEKGTLDGIMYNPYSSGFDESYAVRKAKSLELLDMINAFRSKNANTVYAEKNDLNNEARVILTSYTSNIESSNSIYSLTGYDIYEIYDRLILSGHSLVTNNNKFSIPVGVDVELCGEGLEACFVIENGSIALPEQHMRVAPDKTTEEITPVDFVTTPVLSQPKTETIYNEGDDVVIEMEIQAATQYHIEVFDVESDEYAVNKFLNTDELQIVLPAALFTAGRDYRVIVSAITPEGEALASEPVLISYGAGYDTGVEILSPLDDSVTEENFIPIEWNRGAYYDFGIDLYNSNDELVISTIISGDNNAVIQGVAPGEYYLYLTALRRGTMVQKARASAHITVVDPVIETNEVVLEPGERYDYIYKNEEDGSLYFYNEEIIETEDTNILGELETVKKKKITQKRVKPTETYKQLDFMRAKPPYTTGLALSGGEIGRAAVSLAEQYLGVPYVWGGSTPDGFDCSGLVQYVYASLGINISRVAEDQFNDGVFVDRANLQPGDLVFFQDSTGYIHHVGMYVGGDTMIHAPRTGSSIQYQSLSDPYYQSQYAGARRMY